MTAAAIERRMKALEAKHRPKHPATALVFCGQEDDIAEQERAALASGRMKPGDPVMRIILTGPDPEMETTPRWTDAGGLTDAELVAMSAGTKTSREAIAATDAELFIAMTRPAS